MNKILPLLFFALAGLVAISSVAAGTRIEAKNWRNVQTTDVRALSENLKSHTRELVALKFNFRGKDIHHFKPNWYQGSIWQRDPEGKKSINVRVMIAKKDLPAFKSITTNAASLDEITVYGRVLWDSESNFIFVQLLGRNTAVDPSGNAVVSW
jgi:hypothetical protein